MLTGCGVTGDAPPGDGRLPGVRAELLELERDDQRYERLVIDGDPAIREPGFGEEKERLQVERAERCKAIFEDHGFPGSDRVGRDGSDAFWVLVQHADYDPAFQEAVAVAMAEAHARGVASGTNLAYLTDRVRVNTGRRQLYGTQIDYEHGASRAFPKPLEQPEMVDELRRGVGLDPLWVYMNEMSDLFYTMNAVQLAERGVAGPYEYEPGFSGW